MSLHKKLSIAKSIFRQKRRKRIKVERINDMTSTSVDLFWNRHIVRSGKFKTHQESLQYLQWRFEEYPLFRELMQLYGDHSGEVVLDYGCGPGDDLVGFLFYGKTKRVIGMDISGTALAIAAHTLSLHNTDPEKVRLIQITDSTTRLPLEESSIDFIYSEGVLHHASNPGLILREFFRVLKPSSCACIMVYNRNSLWLHLYTAYDKMILQDAFPGLTLEEAFARTTDSVSCPISRVYAPEEFITLCNRTGFQAEFSGGYLSLHEVDQLKRFGSAALRDERLGKEHKEFLKSLYYDDQGYPLYEGKHAGIGGVYWLKKTQP